MGDYCSAVLTVGVFGTLISGRRADYVSPIVMGDSEQSGDGWSFAWSRDGRSGAASIALTGADAHLTLTLDGRPEERAVLTRRRCSTTRRSNSRR